LSIFPFSFLRLYLFGGSVVGEYSTFRIISFSLLLNFKSNLFILDMSPLSDTCFADISLRPELVFHSLNSVFHRAEVLTFNEVQLT